MRGKIIPVADLAVRLELERTKAGEKRALIVETVGRKVGIVVDEVAEMIRFQDSDIESPFNAAGNGYIRGIGKEGNRLLILLDVDKLFNEDEMDELIKAGQ